MSEFQGFPKIGRFNREWLITEKIDGTNAQVRLIELDGHRLTDPNCVAQLGGLAMFVGSRTRWITPQSDNYGFAQWCLEHFEELSAMGPGSHFGEWYGSGIQRNYGLKEKRFALFNVARWSESRPGCCDVVPLMRTSSGDLLSSDVRWALADLRACGSRLVPGFTRPEGVVIRHIPSGALMKATLDGDGHKGAKQ